MKGGIILTNYLENPILILLVLIIIVVGLGTLGKSLATNIPAQNPAEFSAVNIGDTVVSGQSVVNSNNIRKVPVIYHPDYLIDDLKNQEYGDFYTAITTGSVETPINKITSGNVTNTGVAKGFDGPGMVTVNGSKLVVNAPGTFVWGFKTPYTVAVKTSNGLDIKVQNKTVKSIATADISNSTVSGTNMTTNAIKSWFNASDVGDNLTIDYSLAKFNDGRNTVPPSEILSLFGENTTKYIAGYPSGSPVMVYNAATNQTVVGSGNSVLGAYEEYDNSLRAVNARVFVEGWNNTIVPPHTTAYGKTNVTFVGVYDPELNSYPSHGACPSGRALRAAVMGAGFPLPGGMSSGFYAVSVDANPSSGISIYNPTDYPVKVVLWTVGGGTGMSIYAQAIQYTP
ncbi:MAG: hypothetical protein NKF70_08785 [Methanobacterium sp. ERen5]|nr:MAG: hypothetical protein NKF70_08785 [Methanobacterium sp. ERen5]